MKKILVIGELCIDKFIYGDVNRLSPEAPVPVFNPTKTIENKGMAGNVVENIQSLYDDCDILHWHQKDNIIKTRYVDYKSNHMFIRVDDETLPCNGINYITPEQRRTISESDVVIISDYDKGYLSDYIIRNISEISKLTILDSKRILTIDIIENIDFIKLNNIEYKNNKNLCNAHPSKFIITKGKDGAEYNGKNYESKNPQQTIDVSGAGDTFISAFTLKYLLTNSVEDSINYANDVCSDVVNKKGVSTPDKRFKLK
jgi:D-beta-D-heptose 7-phosphate kinase/D-beta-D-heptose 1-phosphate adenosyltransferase